MPLVEITFNVMAAGAPRKPGDRLELDSIEARLLVGVNRARYVDQPMPVVLDDSAKAPASKPAPKRRKKLVEQAPVPNGGTPTPSALTEDAPPSDPID